MQIGISSVGEGEEREGTRRTLGSSARPASSSFASPTHSTACTMGDSSASSVLARNVRIA